MIFTPEDAAKILSQDKEQTRRLVQRNDRPLWGSQPGPRDAKTGLPWALHGVYQEIDDGKGGYTRLKWEVGRTYAVCPGRGQKAVGHIRLTGIRRERVQDITELDALHEGCHGPDVIRAGDIYPDQAPELVRWAEFAHLWDSIHHKRGARWADNPLVWALSFELVQDGA